MYMTISCTRLNTGKDFVHTFLRTQFYRHVSASDSDTSSPVMVSVNSRASLPRDRTYDNATQLHCSCKSLVTFNSNFTPITTHLTLNLNNRSVSSHVQIRKFGVPQDLVFFGKWGMRGVGLRKRWVESIRNVNSEKRRRQTNWENLIQHKNYGRVLSSQSMEALHFECKHKFWYVSSLCGMILVIWNAQWSLIFSIHWMNINCLLCFMWVSRILHLKKKYHK